MTVKLEGFDKVLEQVGTCGWFQGLVLLCMTLQALLSWHHLSAVFLAAVPPHWCKIPELEKSGWTPEQIRDFSVPKARLGTSYDWDPCTYYDLNYTQLYQASGGLYENVALSMPQSDAAVLQCVNDWEWDSSTYKATVVSDFNLVCHRRILVGTIQGSYMVGVLVGSLLFGSLSDQVLGRRGSVLISLLVSLFGGFGSGLVNSYEGFLFFRFILAGGVAGSYQNLYVLMLEYANPSARAALGLLGQVSFALGYMFLAILGYFFRDWGDFQLVSTAIGLVLLSYYWILPESARWLLYRGDDEKAYKTLCQAARINGKPKPDKTKILQMFHEGLAKPRSCTDKSEKHGEKSLFKKVTRIILAAVDNYWNLLRTPEIRKRTLLIWTLFVIVDLVYFGVVFDSATLTNDPFLLVFLAGLMEVPAYTVVIPCLTALGRKPSVVGTFLFTAICSFVVAFTPSEYEIFRVAVSMSGKLFITTCFAVLYLLGGELFPTSARTTGLASAVIMGRLGSIMAPFVVDLVKMTNRDLPNIIFGLVSIIGGLLSLMLPETKDTEMFDDIEELEKAADEMSLDTNMDKKSKTEA